MAIERLLGEEIGPLAGKLHTGRSRNDQVATDVAMVVQAHSLRAIELPERLMERLLELAERHRDWPMPGYTHLQRAQPVYLGHHLLAYFWMLGRDVLRFQFALDSAAVMPLGSGALAGVNWEIDRDAPSPTSSASSTSAPTRSTAPPTATSSSTTSRRPRPARCTSRGSAPRSSIWSSSEFGFCELDESFSSGSSIMPQKKNPDSAELLRAKSAAGRRAPTRRCSATMHALPLTYGKDMQEDKEPLFDAVDTIELCLDATEGMLAGIEFDRERLEEASGDEMLAATEVADLLVRKGVPFREAHGIVGGLVRDALEQGKPLSELTPRGAARALRASRRLLLRGAARDSWLESKRIEGGTASEALAARSTSPRDARRRQGASARERRRWSGARSERLDAGFFARSVHVVARDLIGCRLLFRWLRRRDRRDRELRARRPRLPRLRRADRRAPRSSSARPAAPTSTSPTASTAC